MESGGCGAARRSNAPRGNLLPDTDEFYIAGHHYGTMFT